MRVLTNVHVRMAVQLVSGGDRVYVYEDYLMDVRPCGESWTLTVVLRGNLPPRALLKSYVHALVRSFTALMLPLRGHQLRAQETCSAQGGRSRLARAAFRIRRRTAERSIWARDRLKSMQVFSTGLQRALVPRLAAVASDRWMGVMGVPGDDANDCDFRRFEVRSSSAVEVPVLCWMETGCGQARSIEKLSSH
jgi:hypothetical protein